MASGAVFANTFVSAAPDGRDLVTGFARPLNGEVTQAADAQDAYEISGARTTITQRTEVRRRRRAAARRQHR